MEEEENEERFDALYLGQVHDVTFALTHPHPPPAAGTRRRLHHQLLRYHPPTHRVFKGPGAKSRFIGECVYTYRITSIRLRLCAFPLPLRPLLLRAASTLLVHPLAQQIPQTVRTSLEWYPEGPLFL